MAISHLLKQNKPITLPSGKRIWQPEFPDLTLSHKTGTVHTAGQTIDFLLTAKQDSAAALCFFRKAIRHHGEPEEVTIDKVWPTQRVCPHSTPTHLMRKRLW
ncbi:DDE-type integrase/transposase/recombinase [Serratia sp. N21D137]|uniref:DDE-type integrase/transposase/recombinase n=1 Tax=Serratia sp. N21D137 TaxID=3397495 RepID=UPI0039E0CE90